ncbi:MAG TPA: hypothetical protein VNC40_16030 [Gaiellaceae bacterium]|nr:hypothetical protein [Gaiellaceae bacterium]
MFRIAVACVLTSTATFLVISATGPALTTGASQSIQAPVGESVHFAVNDLLCVNEPAGGGGRFKTTGVACSSDAQPYRELGFWFTRTRVIITAPATKGGRILYNLKR